MLIQAVELYLKHLQGFRADLIPIQYHWNTGLRVSLFVEDHSIYSF